MNWIDMTKMVKTSYAHYHYIKGIFRGKLDCTECLHISEAPTSLAEALHQGYTVGT